MQINWIFLVWQLTWFSTLLLFICTQKIKNKLLLSVLNFFFFTTFWFYIDLDGIAMFIILSELMVFFFFFLAYSQKYYNLKMQSKINLYKLGTIIFIYFLIVNITTKNLFNLETVIFYNLNYQIVSADFFSVYLFFYVYFSELLILLILLLTYFSVFFILFYNNLKKVTVDTQIKTNTILFLRKQNVNKQSVTKTPIRNFQ